VLKKVRLWSFCTDRLILVNPPSADRGGIERDVVGRHALEFASLMLGEQLQHSFEPKGLVISSRADVHNFSEVNGSISGVQGCLDPAFHPKDGVFKQRASGSSPCGLKSGKLVAHPTGMEAETITPFKSSLTDKV
jgi:hypothetical protein